MSEFIGAVRKTLWHARHGGFTEVREFRRRRQASTQARPARRRRADRGEHSFPEWDVPAPEDLAARHDVTVGVVADEFTTLALQYEWHAIPLSPRRWREQLRSTPIDLLFVESAWHGNEDAWRYQVIGPKGPSARLREMVAHVRASGVPTVFWNKEDPAHYDEAISTARLFDWVFTTDEDLLERYRTELGHDNVAVLPFAAQQTIHNPVRLMGEDGRAQPLRDVAFAGMYFAHKYPERRQQMDTLLGAAIDVSPRMEHGLDIFSRYLGADEDYQFPPPYDAFVRGSLTYPQMLSAYRGYKVFLNVNSVVDSPSMLARRIFEITACGTPVVTTDGKEGARQGGVPRQQADSRHQVQQAHAERVTQACSTRIAHDPGTRPGPEASCHEPGRELHEQRVRDRARDEPGVEHVVSRQDRAHQRRREQPPRPRQRVHTKRVGRPRKIAEYRDDVTDGLAWGKRSGGGVKEDDADDCLVTSPSLACLDVCRPDGRVRSGT